MIELPPKFKQALGNGVRTSLYPLVKIYKGVRIDDPLEDATEVINLSIKETNISGSAYKPLLLNAPSINSSADIINNKYTISSVSLSISNAPFQGKIFSDDIQSLLNAVCQVYYCANGIDSIDDCLLVYTGTIRRFNQSAETIKLELEDLTQQMLSTKIPASTVPDEQFYKEDDIGKPYPMVYGFVDKSPVITRSLGQDTMGELQQELTKFHIDKRGREVEGLWESPNLQGYGNPHLDNTHPLVTEGYIKDTGALSAYEDNFIPIPQHLDFEQEWYYLLNGITDLDDDDYKKVTVTVDKVYEFKQSNGVDSSASIKVNSQALINEEDAIGIPTRIYRPIDKVECFTFCDNIQGDTGHEAINRIYGFTNYDINDTGFWKPWDSYNIIAATGYNSDWSEGGTFDWWQPTLCNANTNGGETSAIDDNWKDTPWKDSDGLFPVDRLQDGDTDKGMYLCGQNPDGERTATQSYNKSGGAAIKLVLKDNVGSVPCSSKIVYDAMYHSFDGMRSSQGGHSGFKRPYYASFWTGEDLPVSSTLIGTFLTASDLIDQSVIQDGEENIYFLEFPYIPNSAGDWEHQQYTDQSLTQDSVKLLNGFGISNTFNNTTAFDNFKFGIPQLKKHISLNGSSHGDDRGYVAVQLFNVYLLQDAVVDQPLDKQFFADVKGRTNNDEVIVSAQNILKDILEDELNYEEGNVELIDEIDTWQNSFTLNEQKEAKEVFEGLFKSSLIIPSFNAAGQFTFIPVHQILDGIEYNVIDNQDILKYSFSLTKIDDIKNSVNVKYNKNYASGEFNKETGYSLIDGNGNEFDTYDQLTQSMYPNDESKWYNIDYYGLTSEEAKLEIETEYVRDEQTARKLQKRLVSWYANQHLTTKIDLPVSYMNLEVGDYIHFNELIGGKKAFGYDYVSTWLKNGQVVYPVFFINKISKSLDKISIEAVQMHRGEYGVPETDIVIDEDDNTVTDEGGNDGQGNFDFGDPNDNPNYGDDTTIVEEEDEEEYLNCNWYQQNSNLNNNPQILLDTNIEGEFICNVFITSNDEEILHPDTQEVLIPIVQDSEYDASNYINVSKTEYTNAEGNIQGGSVMLSTPYLIPQGHNGIEGIAKIFYEGTEYILDLTFTQNYVEPFVPELGDVNGDGNINILDVVMLALAIQGGDEEEADFLQNSPQGDINGDGDLSILDIVALINIIQEQ